MEHSLVKYEYQSQSFPAYRHYVECTCGFQTRQSTEEAAKSQFDNHLVNHNEKPYFANGGSDVPKEDTSAQDLINSQTQSNNNQPQQGFNPFAT